MSWSLVWMEKCFSGVPHLETNMLCWKCGKEITDGRGKGFACEESKGTWRPKLKGSFWWEHVGATPIVPRCLQPSTSDSQKCEQLKSSAGSWHLSHSAAFGPSVRRGSVLDKEARCQRLWSRPPWHHVQCCYIYIYIYNNIYIYIGLYW